MLEWPEWPSVPGGLLAVSNVPSTHSLNNFEQLGVGDDGEAPLVTV